MNPSTKQFFELAEIEREYSELIKKVSNSIPNVLTVDKYKCYESEFVPVIYPEEFEILKTSAEILMHLGLGNATYSELILRLLDKVKESIWIEENAAKQHTKNNDFKAQRQTLNCFHKQLYGILIKTKNTVERINKLQAEDSAPENDLNSMKKILSHYNQQDKNSALSKQAEIMKLDENLSKVDKKIHDMENKLEHYTLPAGNGDAIKCIMRAKERVEELKKQLNKKLGHTF